MRTGGGERERNIGKVGKMKKRNEKTMTGTEQKDLKANQRENYYLHGFDTRVSCGSNTRYMAPECQQGSGIGAMNKEEEGKDHEQEHNCQEGKEKGKEN